MDSSMLFLDPAFFFPGAAPPAEEGSYFRLRLLAELIQAGRRLVIPARPEWTTFLRDRTGLPSECWLAGPNRLSGNWGALMAFYRARHRRFSLLLTFETVGALPMGLWAIRQFRMAGRAILIARRPPTRAVVSAMGRFPCTVAAANRRIAQAFTGGLYGQVDVFGGLAGAHRFDGLRPSPSPDAPVAFCVMGDLSQGWRGVSVVLRALDRLPEDVADRVRVHLVGFRSPPRIPNPRVQTYPPVPCEERGNFLRQMDVMIAPSAEEENMLETFDETVVQGMLASLPVIAFDAGTVGEKAQDGAGLTFQTDEELASAMTALATDPDRRRRMGERARANALARYCWNTSDFIRRYLGS